MYEQYKRSHELQKGNSRAERGVEENDPERSTDDPLRYRCITLINRKSTMVQAPGAGHAGLGKSESCPISDKMSAKWRA